MVPEVQDVMVVAYQMMWTTALLALPVLMTALLVGVLISLLQTVTGVQEMTLTFVPKLLGVMIALAIALPWMNAVLMEFTRNLWDLMSSQ